MLSILLMLKLTPDFAIKNLLSEGITKDRVVNDENSRDQKSDVLSKELSKILDEFRVIFDLLIWRNVHN
jgi:hypothetical protein